MTKYFVVLILAISFCGTAAALENPYRTYREAAERISIDIEAVNNAALLLEQLRTNGTIDETNKYKAIPDGMNRTLIFADKISGRGPGVYLIHDIKVYTDILTEQIRDEEVRHYCMFLTVFLFLVYCASLPFRKMSPNKKEYRITFCKYAAVIFVIPISVFMLWEDLHGIGHDAERLALDQNYNIKNAVFYDKNSVNLLMAAYEIRFDRIAEKAK